jgi:hypothetical protein
VEAIIPARLVTTLCTPLPLEVRPMKASIQLRLMICIPNHFIQLSVQILSHLSKDCPLFRALANNSLIRFLFAIMIAANNPITTVVLGGAALTLGLPIAGIAIILEKIIMPDIVLGNKEIDIGPGGTKTVTFSLLSGPNDAVFAAAYISVIATIFTVGGLIMVRHFTRHSIWGWLVFLPALSNVLGQIGCCTYVFIVNGQYPEAVSRNEIGYVDGHYNTNGNMYSRESWACSMKSLYLDQEGWSDKACSNFVRTTL